MAHPAISFGDTSPISLDKTFSCPLFIVGSLCKSMKDGKRIQSDVLIWNSYITIKRDDQTNDDIVLHLRLARIVLLEFEDYTLQKIRIPRYL